MSENKDNIMEDEETPQTIPSRKGKLGVFIGVRVAFVLIIATAAFFYTDWMVGNMEEDAAAYSAKLEAQAQEHKEELKDYEKNIATILDEKADEWEKEVAEGKETLKDNIEVAEKVYESSKDKVKDEDIRKSLKSTISKSKNAVADYPSLTTLDKLNKDITAQTKKVEEATASKDESKADK